MYLLTSVALAWPTGAEWKAVQRGGSPLTDPCDDVGGRSTWDIHGDLEAPAAYVALDGDTLYLRMRLRESPLDDEDWDGHVWGALLDTRTPASNWDLAIYVDGKEEQVILAKNTTAVSDWRDDPPEEVLARRPARPDGSGAVRVVPTAEDRCGDDAVFLDFRIGWAEVQSEGVGSLAEVGFVFLSSASTEGWSKDVAGCTGKASDCPDFAALRSDQEHTSDTGLDTGAVDTADTGTTDTEVTDTGGTDTENRDSDSASPIEGLEPGGRAFQPEALCGCTAPAPGPGWLALLAVLGLRRRRR